MLLVLLLLAGAAYADQAVKLEGTRFTLALPDEMEYDGPGKPGKADFAYVSGSLGLEILFGEPKYSSDNAAGVALLGEEMHSYRDRT